MTNYFIQNAIVGTEASKPDPANPAGAAEFPNYPLFIAGDTGKIYQSTGSAWVHVDTVGPTGVTTDAQGDMTVGGERLYLRNTAAGLSRDLVGDMFSVASFHAPTLFTAGLSSEPQLAQQIGGGSASFATLKGTSDAAPSFNDYYYAQQFSATVTADILRISLAARLNAGFTGDPSTVNFNAALYTDVAGAPGVQIAGASTPSVTGSAFAGLEPGAWGTATCALPAVAHISSGSPYWLVIYVATRNVGYPAIFDFQADATSATAVDSIDEAATWQTVASQKKIIASLSKQVNLGVQDPVKCDFMIGEYGKTPPATPVSITGTLTAATLAQLTSIVSELLVALDAKGTIIKATT